MSHIVIIGNGISGITAARHIRKCGDDRITVISGESAHFFSRTALMYVYMGHMRFEHIKPYADDFWASNRIELIQAWVVSVDGTGKHVHFKDGTAIAFDKLIIASGSNSNKFGWVGQDLPGVQGLYSMQDLDLMERNTKGISSAVIVGGGLIGVEMAEMMHSRGIHVTFLVREEAFWSNVLPKQDAHLIGRHMREHGVDLRLNTELDEVLAGDDGRVKAIRTKSGEEIVCQFVGLAVGVHPNIDFIKNGSDIATDKGVLINEFLQTNMPDIYAIGDCAQFQQHPDPQRKAIEQVWYTGRKMGETVARTTTGDRTPYDPGIWFNSSKFFDIEFQTYGRVHSELKPGEDEHYWEHPDGKVALHFVWALDSRVLHGVNAFGIRLRHEVFDGWLRSGATLDHVMENLAEANFDPEFYRLFEPMVRASFNTSNTVIA